MDVPGPPLSPDHPDRATECEFAIEPAFQALAEAAERAGWTGEEVAAALVGLAAAHLAARRENARTETAIATARRKVSQ